jgi:hypothetical protein
MDNEIYDPLDIKNLRLSPKEMAELCLEKDGSPTPVSRAARQSKLKFYQFPPSLLEALVPRKASGATLGVLLVLYEKWFADPDHYNPLFLPTLALHRFGISRHQKRLALSILKTTGHISIYQEKGNNPLITLHWLPLKAP